MTEGFGESLELGRPLAVMDRGRPGREGPWLVWASSVVSIGLLARALARSIDICSRAASSSGVMSSILLPVESSIHQPRVL
jgi:hypothetical protein